jgi:ABC-type branched-subunit amino acid transport system ATPase component
VTSAPAAGARPRTDTRHPAHLSVEGVSVRFGGVLALDEVAFTAEPGSIVGLIGANGSGKTTMLDVISGLVTPGSGRVRIDGVDLDEYLPEERLGVGVVRSFQDCRLFPELTVLDVLLLSEDARHEVAVLPTTLRLPWARRAERRKLEAVDQVIAAFGLERFRQHRTSELSTGTRRVVDLASIVLARPRLLLLDEPTAGIAQREAEAFVPLLRRLHRVADTTVVLVEHDVPLVFELCTTVIVMELGRVVAAGPPEQVRADPRALAAYLGASDEALMASGPVAGTGDPGGDDRSGRSERGSEGV